MVARVQQVEGEYRVVLSPEAVEALHLSDGAEVEIIARPAPAKTEHRHASIEEGLAAFRRAEPPFRNSFIELAK